MITRKVGDVMVNSYLKGWVVGHKIFETIEDTMRFEKVKVKSCAITNCSMIQWQSNNVVGG